MTFRILLCAAVLLNGESKTAPESTIDRIVRETGVTTPPTETTGSLWSPDAQLSNLAGDLRPRRINDMVTIVVRDRASAIARGTSKSARAAQASGGVSAIFGTPPGGSRLPNMLSMSGASSLDGQGETSRETVLSTTLSARVTHVLPNGLLVVQGQKSVRVNSEMQTVTVRGLMRPVDVSPINTVFSDQVAELEIAVNGKGIVGDAVRRPNILYRILLGILPF